MSDQPSESPSEVADAHETDISNDAAPTAQDESPTAADAVATGAVQADEQPHESDDKPGIFRRTGLILVGILLALPVGAILLFGEGLLLGMFASGLGLLGVRVAPTTDLDAHFTGGALVAKDFGLDQPRSPSSGRRVFSADSAEIDMDVWSSLTGAGVHLERVTMTGGRFEDRVYEHEPVDDSVLVQVPGAEPDVPGPIPDPEDPDWQGWQAWAEQWYERLRPWLDDVAIASGQPEAVPAGPHPHDVTYLPPVVPTSEADAALPRFLIRALLINNLNIGGSGALALRGATLEGANIGAGLVPGGPTTLTLSGPTAAAGDVQAQATLQAGSVALEAVVPAAPVATLVAALPADNDLHAAGMQGTSSLTLRLGLGRGAALDGLFFIEIQDF
ncbi:MAG: hypothetical protein MJH10_20845, partial [Epibacterium sp.]|nr:hypothetical protein [Epibacterium sp.]NQX75907.1 hypothetical protein [Epibacterium sp.]